jgi:hypothetical protein
MFHSIKYRRKFSSITFNRKVLFDVYTKWQNRLCNNSWLFTVYLLLYFFCSCCSHLEHRASVKRFFSLQFLTLRQSVGLLGRGISPSQGHDLTQTDIHALNGIRTHDPSVREGEDISCLRRRGHCGRHSVIGLQKYICTCNKITRPTNYIKSRVYKICVYLLHFEHTFPFFRIYGQCSFITLVKVCIPRFSSGSLCSIVVHSTNMRESVWFFL